MKTMEQVGISSQGYDKWVAAFVFEHAVLFLVALFFTQIPNEPKGAPPLLPKPITIMELITC